MRHLMITSLLVLAVSFGNTSCASDRPRQVSEKASQPAIPRIWDDEALASLELPLVNARFSPVHVSSDFYYRIPVRPIYKGYPVYAPGKEPVGYFDWLKNQNPEEIFDASRLKTEEDWVKAGEIIFDAPIGYELSNPFLAIVTVDQIRSPDWYAKTGALVAGDGTVPYLRYVIREKGVVELGTFSCAMCHTRVMPDGAVIKGAQGNFPFDRAIAYSIRATAAASGDEKKALEQERQNIRLLFGAPWMRPDPLERVDRMSFDETMKAYEAIPPGVLARGGTHIFHPVQVPDLIGLKERLYLDRTGLQLHRSAADLMRYASLNQDVGFFSRYGDFIPGGEDFRKLPDAANLSRYSDEQLYALALYIYSLRPPPNPNKFDEMAERGQKIFERERCSICHTPPLYTSNGLIPAEGFKVPDEHREKYDVLPFSVGTDPTLALRTRRGTGYYKVPSLRGVWYRGPFEHNGSVATLEDWFDPRRTRAAYVPTGFRGHGVKARAVKGHTFGHKLPAEERAALIAFLRTL